MTSTRVNLITCGLIAAVLAVQAFVLGVWATGINIAGFGLTAAQVIGPYLFVSLLVGLLHCAAFGLGVYFALRTFAAVDAETPWRQTIVRAIVATVSGAVVAFVFSAIVSLIASITIGAYPFGYALNAAVDGYKVQYGIQNAISGALEPLLGWLPLTVLGIVFLRLWLAAHHVTAKATDATGRASVAAKP